MLNHGVGQSENDMYERLPIRAIALGFLALLVWWLWPAGGGANLVDIPVSAANADGRSPLVSAVQPLGSFEQNSGSRVRPASVAIEAELLDKFEGALEFTKQGDQAAAIETYKSIINANPNIIEAHANLAAIYASQNQLNMAHQTLTSGLKANDKSSALFSNLQKVLGALASKAYRDALEQDQQQSDSLALQAFDTLRDSGPTEAQLAELQNQIESLQEEKQANLLALQKFEAERAELQNLELELVAANGAITTLKDQHQLDLDAMQAKLDDQRLLAKNLVATNEQRLKDQEAARIIASQEAVEAKAERQRKDLELAEINAKLEQERKAKEQLLAQQSELAEAQQLAKQQQQALADAQAEQQRKDRELAEINTRLEQERKAKEQLLAQQSDLAEAQQLAKQQQQALADAQAEQQRKDRELAEINAKLESERKAKEQLLAQQSAQKEDQRLALLAQQQTAQQQAATASANQQQDSRKQIAIKMVESWADAWSKQAVSEYVSHYASEYSPPGSGLSHQQWLKQRQERLTNKTFINVGVSEFSVKPTDSGFSVEFSQHYKSNTMDDRIRKRLDFSSSQTDWQDAKIVRERVVGR